MTKKFDEFIFGNECQVGDQVVGLRDEENYRFEFPSTGIKDAYGNFLIGYESIADNSINYVKFFNAVNGSDAVISANSDINLNVNLQLKSLGTGNVNVNVPTGYFNINSTTGINAILDEDDFNSDSATAVPTQQSVKAYIQSLPNVVSVTGTANRITVTGTTDVVVDIASTYVGQTSITTLGTITTGTWSGSTIAIAKGGTNSATTLTNGKLMASASGAIVEVNAASSMNGQRITSLGTPTSDTDAATKAYVDTAAGGLVYQGNWDASTNTPTLTAGTGIVGNFYICTVAGTQTAPSGSSTSYAVNDRVVYGDNAIWNKVADANGVISINGATGVLTLAGTSNQVIVSTVGTTLTLSTPQNIAAASTPTFAGMTISSMSVSQLVATNGSNALQTLTTATYPSLTEISYVKGVTSAIQTQLNGKQAYISCVQGDVFYASGTDTITTLPKTTSTPRYLANTGASNNPEWKKINLASGVEGNLPVANLNGALNANSTTFWRGDGTWANATVTNSIAPTIQKFTSGSGTYTLPTSPRTPLYIRVQMSGGGAGGQGSGSTTVASSPAGSTTFGTLLSCAGGNGIVGGTATISSPAVGLAIAGGYGSTGGVEFNSGGFPGGGSGAQNTFGGAGAGSSNAVGFAAIANTGAGGGGSGPDSTSGNYAGAGGGAGGYIDAIIYSPASTYSYLVGSGSAGGTAATHGFAGGAGAAGIIIVTEYYQ